MRIKNLFKTAFAVSVLFSSSAAWAQGQQWQKKTPEERAQNQTGWMQKNLALTQEQGQKVYDINLYYAREADSVMNAPKGRERKAQRQEIERDKEGELKTILTADQYQRYQAHVAEVKQRMEQRRNMQQEEGGNN